MRLRIVAVTLLFAVGGCVSPIGPARTLGGPVTAAPTGIVHVAAVPPVSGPIPADVPPPGSFTLTGPVTSGSVSGDSTVTDPVASGSMSMDPVPAGPAASGSTAADPVPAVGGVPQAADPQVPDMKPDTVRSRRPENDFPVPLPRSRPDCHQTKCVALTFDDGPGPYTGMLLDILARYQARATFFVLGRMVAEDHEGNLDRMVAGGHELGNHTWDHLDLVGLPEAAIRSQLRRTQEVVRRTIGAEMTLMRPPYGSTNARVTEVSRGEGLAQVLWNVDTEDWLHRKASIVTARGASVEPGSIVLMHDIYSSTILAVPRLLNELTAQGYTFVTISELYGKPLTGGPTRGLTLSEAAMARLKALDTPAQQP
jgi:peptidoglycan-N-acetylglucosamine deacetylase